MAVSFDDVDAALAWLDVNRRDLRAIDASNVSPDELERLAREGDAYVRARIAQTTAAGGILGILAEDAITWVREAVAGNDNTSEELLKKLASDESASVRLCVGGRAEVPESIQRVLVQDGDPGFRKRLVEITTCPGVFSMLTHDADEAARMAVARCLFTPDDVKMMLAEDESVDVRLALVRGTGTPEEVLTKLAKDDDPKVREAALRFEDLNRPLPDWEDASS